MNMKTYGNSYAIVHSDGIIEIGISGQYRLKLHMLGYAQRASVSDFKHHLYFLSKCIMPEVFMEYLDEWRAFICLNLPCGSKKNASLLKALAYYIERTEPKLV